MMRRMGLSPIQRCVSDANCPDVFRLADGRFIVIGSSITDDLRSLLPVDIGLGEQAVIVDAVTMTCAARDVVLGQ